MGYAIDKKPCPSCRAKGNDRSGDNLVVYDDGGKTCFACGYVEYSREWRFNGKKDKEEYESIMEKTSDKIISKKENEELKSKTGQCDYRGVRSDIWKQLGVRFTFDQEASELTPTAQYYPNTLDGKLSGYKVRLLPKDFGKPLGEVGAVCDFYGTGPFFRKPNQRTLLLVGGEIDHASVYQVLYDSAVSRGYKHPNILVASPSVGEKCNKQVKYNHKFLKEFDEILVGLDNDDAGREAALSIIEDMPNVRIKLVTWTKKDPNEMLQAGLNNEIISCIYNARVYTSARIKGSSRLFTKVAEEASKEMLPLPPFMKKISLALGGGIPLNSIVNIGSNSGTGKTTIVNEMVYYWVFNSPYPVGIVSMELSEGQYAEVLLSRHIGRKIALMPQEQKMAYLETPNVKEKAAELFSDGGKDRFYLVDDNDADLQGFMSLVEEMVISCGCKVIILDPLQDVIDGLSNEEQALFMKWQKTIRQKYDIIFINICHLRKTANGITDAETGLDILYSIGEEDFQGTSAIFKSGSINILTARAKRATDSIEKNTTYIMLDKARSTGQTGRVGEWYYDNDSHTMYDKEEYFEKHKIG